MTQTTRRALLAAATVPAIMAAAPAAMAATTTTDPRWSALVADYHAKRAAWLDTCGGEDDLQPEVNEALAALPPEPIKPPSANMDHLTLAQIRDMASDPASEAAWQAYQRDRAAWNEKRDAVREAIVSPAKTLYRSAYARYADALNALASYRTTALPHLAEKMAIIAADYEGCDIPPEYLREMRADVLHMAGRAA